MISPYEARKFDLKICPRRRRDGKERMFWLMPEGTAHTKRMILDVNIHPRQLSQSSFSKRKGQSVFLNQNARLFDALIFTLKWRAMYLRCVRHIQDVLFRKAACYGMGFYLLMASNAAAQLLLPPELISPPDGSSNQSTSIVLDWGGVLGATSYNLEVSTTSLFTTTTFNDTINDV